MCTKCYTNVVSQIEIIVDAWLSSTPSAQTHYKNSEYPSEQTTWQWCNLSYRQTDLDFLVGVENRNGTVFSCLCVIVLLSLMSHLLTRLRALNERSVVHEVAGLKSSKRTSTSTYGNKWRPSGLVVWSSTCLSFS